MVEGVVLIIHIVGFLAVFITLWVLAPLNSQEMVFRHFTNYGGWSSTGLSVMVGMLTSVYGMLGADSAVHMGKRTSPHPAFIKGALLTKSLSQPKRSTMQVSPCLALLCGRLRSMASWGSS